MIKYIEYLSVLLCTLFRKIFGIIFIYFTLPFRRFANNYVFNYVLQKNVYLQRLLERPISELGAHIFNGKEFYGWLIFPYHGAQGGYIKYRNVNKTTYYLVYFCIFGWNDADCNDDTFDYGHVERLTREGGFLGWLVKGAARKQYGNSFDLGDARESNFHFGATTQWNFRNTAYGFKYMQFEKPCYDKNLFLHTVGKYQFGWVKDTDKDNYSLAFGGV